MKKLVAEHKLDVDITSDEAFTLGLLHDLGYSFATSGNHAHTLGSILKDDGYKFWREVYYHGVVNSGYNSPELLLLNIADMSVTAGGEIVSFNNRLIDIGNRHGFESKVYFECCDLVNSFKDILGNSFEDIIHCINELIIG